MGKLMRAIGLMSGTSLDGIDVALIDTDGADRVERGPSATYAYEPAFRDDLRHAIAEAVAITARDARPGRLAAIEERLTELHADAVARFLAETGIAPSSVELLGFHGQTVLHRPADALTVQLGDGPALARKTGIDTIYDMRAADVTAGGQGAPLVPIYHRALVAKLEQRPIAFVNIGGVANVTWISSRGQLLAFDTGPGNALIDDWMKRHSNHTFDEGGRFAATGRVHDDYVSEYLRNSHFAAPPPKSLDRNAFPLELVSPLTASDGAATLTRFTATSIARAREHMPAEPQLWIIAGGGRRNRTLMGMIAASVENAVVPAEAVGIDGDSLEAEAWAYLAVRSWRGFPLTFPGTTGVASPMRGGLHASVKA